MSEILIFNTISLFLVLCTLTFSGISVILSGFALFKVMSMERATHSVTFMPVDEAIDEANQKFLEEKWATSEESLSKQRKLFREDLEEQMPEFAVNKEDFKTYSF